MSNRNAEAGSGLEKLKAKTMLRTRGKPLDKSTFPQFLRELYSSLDHWSDGGGRGRSMRNSVMTIAEWEADPLSEIEGQQQRLPRPTVGNRPIYPEFRDNPGDTQQARTLLYQRYNIVEKETERRITGYNQYKACHSELKVFLADPEMFGEETSSTVAGPDNLYDQAQLYDMMARLLECLGTLDEAAYRKITAIYTAAYPTEKSIAQYFNDEEAYDNSGRYRISSTQTPTMLTGHGRGSRCTCWHRQRT